MRPTGNQQFAIRTILNTLIGPGEFDRLCLGMQVECVEDGFCTCSCQTRPAPQRSKLIIPMIWPPQPKQVFSQPIRIVNVLPMDFSSQLKRGG